MTQAVLFAALFLFVKFVSRSLKILHCSFFLNFSAAFDFRAVCIGCPEAGTPEAESARTVAQYVVGVKIKFIAKIIFIVLLDQLPDSSAMLVRPHFKMKRNPKKIKLATTGVFKIMTLSNQFFHHVHRHNQNCQNLPESPK